MIRLQSILFEIISAKLEYLEDYIVIMNFQKDPDFEEKLWQFLLPKKGMRI